MVSMKDKFSDLLFGLGNVCFGVFVQQQYNTPWLFFLGWILIAISVVPGEIAKYRNESEY